MLDYLMLFNAYSSSNLILFFLILLYSTLLALETL